MEHKPQDMLIITLDDKIDFVWRSEMSCLKTVKEGQQVEELQPGDLVLFNNCRRIVSSIRPYY